MVLSLARAVLVGGLIGLLGIAARVDASDDTVAMRRASSSLRSSDAATRRRGLSQVEVLLRRDVRLTPCAILGLRDVLARRSASQAASAVRLLAKDPLGFPLWLDTLDPTRDPEVFLSALDAAHGVGERGARALLDRARDARRTPGVRALCLEALGRTRAPGAEIVLRKPLGAVKENETWLLASARALALRHLGDRPAALAMVELLEHRHVAPRVHAWEGLVLLTRQHLPVAAKAWRDWFRAHPDALTGKESEEALRDGAAGDRYTPPRPVHVPHYYGIPIDRPRSHVVFCLDVSQSMYGPGIEQARGELEKTLLAMPTTYAFDIVAFNTRVIPFRRRLVPAHPVVKANALRWARALKTLAYTNLYDAVETAFGIGGVGARTVDRPARLDAVFLLSDGAPNRGRFRKDKRVVDAIAALSAGKVPVHCVAAGVDVFPLLRRIAEATGGRFVDAFHFE